MIELYEEVCTYCGKKEHYAKGLCKTCYTRVWHSGELDRRGSNAAKKAIIDAEYKAKMAAKRQARIDSCNPTTERGEKFLEMYKSGKTLQEIADLHGITKERVRQVMKGV